MLIDFQQFIPLVKLVKIEFVNRPEANSKQEYSTASKKCYKIKRQECLLSLLTDIVVLLHSQ